MAGIELTLKLKLSGDGNTLAFDINRGAHNELWEYLNTIGPKTNWYFNVRLARPFKPKTTGPHSQLNRHWGHCEDIAEQLSTEARRYTKDMVDWGLRVSAVKEGLPTKYNEVADAVEPIGFSEMSVEDAMVVERVKQKMCDETGMWLTEFVDPQDPKKGTYKSVGGRTNSEMEAYWREQRRAKDVRDPADEDLSLF
jgi:hypothetical protein